ncbi:MAG: serpin family protein [Actinomycetota bacterium]
MARRLYELVSEVEAGNFILSPYSIATAFAMAEVGAEAETGRQLRSALGIDASTIGWHAGRSALDTAVRTPLDTPKGASPLELEIANGLFAQAGFSMVEDFVGALTEHYRAAPTSVDFTSDPEAARALINSWVAQQTADRITELLSEGVIDEDVRLVLVNTVFFRGLWLKQFDPDRTVLDAFTLLDGTVLDVEMMNGTSRTVYGEGDGWQMVRMRYWGGYSMTVILPAPDRFTEITDRFSIGLLDEISAQQSDRSVNLTIPKFTCATPTDLIPVFRSLGVIDAFDPARADFSGASTELPLYVSSAVHQATIEVDEFGTTATAATAIVGRRVSAPRPAEFRADRPFVYLIEHDATGEPLFIGRVANPTT